MGWMCARFRGPGAWERRCLQPSPSLPFHHFLEAEWGRRDHPPQPMGMGRVGES